MAFWSTERLEQEIKESPIVSGASVRIKHGAFELSLGPEVFITSQGSTTKCVLQENQQLGIPPGQFGLLLTEEEVCVPTSAIAFISIRARLKFRGLVNVSGFHVDPGFRGRLKFSVFNAGSEKIILQRGDRLFLLWFSDLDRETADTYKPDWYQNGLTSDDVSKLQGHVASPQSLEPRIKKLEDFHKTLKAILLGIVIVVAGWFFTDKVIPFFNNGQPASPSTQSTPEPTVLSDEIPTGAAPQAGPDNEGATETTR